MALEDVPEAEQPPAEGKDKLMPHTAFLRAARAGRLDAVSELLDSSAVHIDTANSNGLNALHLAAKEGHGAVVDELLRRGAAVDAATKKGNTALHIACLAGQEGVARALLAAGAKADAQSAAGFTPLYMAAQENHASVVRLLLQHGADPAKATHDGFTPLAVAMQQGHDTCVAELLEADARGRVRLPALHIAAKKNDVKAASLLLEAGHDPDACSKSGFTPLHIAAHYGNVAVAKALLQAGADAARQAKHAITPLHVACKWGQLALLDLLVDHGAGVAVVTRDGLTPLHCAARSGHAPVVTRLLQHGAPIASKTKNGLTPLHMAVQGEHADTAKVLLENGAPIDDVTVDYLTALHVAAHCGHARVARLLLERNADANARALNGFTPLHIACKKNRLKVVELLLRHGAARAATTESGLTPLHVAAFMGCVNIAVTLLQAGADADACTARGETPLHLAARAQQVDLVRILLRHGARVEARAREEQTPLHVAARLGHADIVALLLQHGADVGALTKDAYTPLHIAAKEGKEEAAAQLIEHSAPLNAETRKGFTPLHLAAKYGSAGVARLLLQHGADTSARGRSHIAPLHMAVYYGHPDIALLLLDKGASPHALAKNGHSALHIACRHNHPDIAFALLEHGAEAGAKSAAGFTPLHMAAQEGHDDCVEMLLERGAVPGVAANNGLTPLHLAAAEGRVPALQALLAAGADVHARSAEGYTPLHAAAHNGHSNAAKVLLDAGADVKASAGAGHTPLHQAAQQGHAHVIQLLLDAGADPDALTQAGQTACGIAERLGYISAVESLRPGTAHTLSRAVGESGGLDGGKYRPAAPELMQDAFLSDSEDEGGEAECPLQLQQQYRYMNAESATLRRVHEHVVADPHRWPSNNDKTTVDIPDHTVQPDRGFLVSFVVDARGGVLRARRRGGARILVPPAACSAPTRVTCRATRRVAAPVAQPPLMEGEALVCRLLELQPAGVKFHAPVVIEVPIYSAPCPDREIVVLRSDTGETWQDHYLQAQDDPLLQEALTREAREQEDELGERIARIVTADFPHYLAVVTRVRQEVHVVGAEGGTISSITIPQVQALFPPNALTKRIRVGVQAHGAPPELCRRLLPRAVAVSPVLTVEPRRRKFHRTITLTVPLPTNCHDPPDNTTSTNNTIGSSLRLLCSIMGGQARAVWEDVTGSTPLSIGDGVASFTTTVSARFWLMECRSTADATRLATALYREMLLVSFRARLYVLARRQDALEGRLLILYLTDRNAPDAELSQHYTHVATSTAIELREGRSIHLEFSGNLLCVTKSAERPALTFEAFKDNRLELTMRLKRADEAPTGRLYFMDEPKQERGATPQAPLCVLDVLLPNVSAGGASAVNTSSHHDHLHLDQSGFDALKDELGHPWDSSLVHDTTPSVHDNSVTSGFNGLLIPNGHAKVGNGDVIRSEGAGGDRATFDSDEERTPHATLDKPKSQEKQLPATPPSTPAPHLIQEGLLDKMENVFKDLKTAPHRAQTHVTHEVHSALTDLEKQADDKFNVTKHQLEDTKGEVLNGLNNVAKDAHTTVGDVQKKSRDVVDDVERKVSESKNKANEVVNEAKVAVNNAVTDAKNKTNEAKNAVGDAVCDATQKASATVNDAKNKANEAVNDVDNKTTEAIDEVKRKANVAVNEAKQSAADATAAVSDTVSDARHQTSEKVDEVKQKASEVVNDVTRKANVLAAQASSKLQDGVEQATHKAEEARDAVRESAQRAGLKLSNAYNDVLNITEHAEANADEVESTARHVVDEVVASAERDVLALDRSKSDAPATFEHHLNNIAAAVYSTPETVTSALTGFLLSERDHAQHPMQHKPEVPTPATQSTPSTPNANNKNSKKGSSIPKLKKKH